MYGDLSDIGPSQYLARKFEIRCTINWCDRRYIFCQLTLSLPRVVNLKFPLQPDQKYYIHSMKNLAFHGLLGGKMIILPILTSTSPIFLSLGGLGGERAV